jgi:hypothetical protein
MAVTTGAADVVVCYRALNERSGRRFLGGPLDEACAQRWASRALRAATAWLSRSSSCAHQGGLACDLDGVTVDLGEQRSTPPAVIGPLERGHLQDLQRIAGPCGDELVQLRHLADPFRGLPRGQLDATQNAT